MVVNHIAVTLPFGQSQDINKLVKKDGYQGLEIDRKTWLWSIPSKFYRALIKTGSIGYDEQGLERLHFKFQVNRSSYARVMDGSILVRNGFGSISSYRLRWLLVWIDQNGCGLRVDGFDIDATRIDWVNRVETWRHTSYRSRQGSIRRTKQ